jgi:hypothetical protein
MVLATNTSQHGESRFTSTATAVISTLRTLRAEKARDEGRGEEEEEEAWKKPTVVILRATTLNPKFNAHEPWVLGFALKWLYGDMVAANVLYEQAVEEGLVEVVYVE